MLYFSSQPVAPDSIDKVQYEKLSIFMEECRKQGLVERYDSITVFREKLSRQIASKILDIHKIPGDEILRDGGETVKKESNDMLSEQFCDLIEGYNVDWTTEKTIEPVSLDNGRQILQDLTEKIINFRVPLAKIFGKEVIEVIDRIISKLKILQTHQLYLDGGKSYNEFWELGDEIFLSLDAIVGAVRKDIHIPKIDKNMENILKELSIIENSGIKSATADVIAKSVGLSMTETNYYLGKLVEIDLVDNLFSMGSPTRYVLEDKGREYLILREIK